jgi:hypothetical protein
MPKHDLSSDISVLFAAFEWRLGKVLCIKEVRRSCVGADSRRNLFWEF